MEKNGKHIVKNKHMAKKTLLVLILLSITSGMLSIAYEASALDDLPNCKKMPTADGEWKVDANGHPGVLTVDGGSAILDYTPGPACPIFPMSVSGTTINGDRPCYTYEVFQRYEGTISDGFTQMKGTFTQITTPNILYNWDATRCIPVQKISGRPSCDVVEGNPIHAGNGNKYQQEIDYQSSNGLSFVRHYNGRTNVRHWQSNWQSQILGDGSSGQVTIIRPDGAQNDFSLINDLWQTDASVNEHLTRLTNSNGQLTGWEYRTADQVLETYNANGKLQSLSDRYGNVTLLYYSDGSNQYLALNDGSILPAGLLVRIVGPFQHQLKLGYDNQNRLIQMQDPAGQIYKYEYVEFGKFSKVIYPDNSSRTYHYENSQYKYALTGITDENNKRYASWEYDSQGRAKLSEHGAKGSGIDKVQLVYNTNNSTTITDARGTVRTKRFEEILGELKSVGINQPGGSGCSASVNNQTYDSNGNKTSRTDFKGNTSCSSYDLTRNLITVQIDGLAPGKACASDLSGATLSDQELKTTYQWHHTYRLPSEIASSLRRYSFIYDDKGNLTSLTSQATSDINGQNGFNASTIGNPRTTFYTYTRTGKIWTIDGPRSEVSDVTTYGYDAQDNLITITNALNHTTTLSGYDAHGRPHTITDPTGLVTQLTYNYRGYLKTIQRGSERTEYGYDNVGNLTNVSLPNGASYILAYDDAHRLTRVTDKDGNYIEYTLDKMGNRTYEEVKTVAGDVVRKHAREFDALNRLWKDIGAVNQTTVYEYDANGNLTKEIAPAVTDPITQTLVSYTTQRSYDALNRLITYADAMNGVTQFERNGLDQLTKVIDPRNLVTQYIRDGLYALAQTSPDTGLHTTTYDAAGNVSTHVDANGQESIYTYDALNRITGISYTGISGQNMSFEYDQGLYGVGHLTQVTENVGSANPPTTSYSYNQYGRLISEIRQAYGATYTTGYAYDTNGRLSAITYPSGRIISYDFDSQGRIQQIKNTFNGLTTTVVSNIRYVPFAGVLDFSYGDGSVSPKQNHSRQFDQDGRNVGYALKIETSPVQEDKRGLGYDALSRILSVTNPNDISYSANYSYDALNRVISYTQGSINQSFSYDADNNRISQLIGSTSTTYTYPTNSNRIGNIQIGALAPIAPTFDANGSTKTDAARQYNYDARGRMVQVTTAQGSTYYSINAQGLRTRKTTPYSGIDTVYHYDVNGLLIGESGAGSTIFSAEYIYLGSQPVAIVK